MTEATATVAAAEPHVIPLARINVAEDHNPRVSFDEEDLAALTESIRNHGVIQPVLVSPDDDNPGEYRMVAGERRYRAACAAALTEIPALVRSTENGDALDLAITENLHRAQLNPIEEAHAYQRGLQGSGLTQAKLAERLQVKPRRISEGLRLLRLPEEVQGHIAGGLLPASSSKTLEAIAKVSAPVATAVAALVACGDAEPDQLDEQAAQLVAHVADTNENLVCVPATRYELYEVAELPLLEETRQEIVDRVAALPTGRLAVQFGDDDRDAARAYGCLLEVRGLYMQSAFICDSAFLADRVRLALDEAEKQAVEEQTAADAEQADPAGGGAAGTSDEALAAEAAADAKRKQAREEERQDRIEARGANLQLGRKLAEKFHEPQLTKDVARLLALCVLDEETSGLAMRGLRYVREDWQEDQSRELKSGEHREKIVYLEATDAEAALWQWFEQARTAEQMIGRVVQALIAAHHADQSAVARSNQAYYTVPGTWGLGPATAVPKLVQKLAKRVLPPRLAEQLADAEAKRARFAGDDD